MLGKLMKALPVVVAACLCVCALAGCSNKALQDIDSKVQKAVQEQFGPESGFEGYASANYVNPSDYNVSSVEVSGEKADGAVVSGMAAVTLENASFRTKGNYAFTANADSDGNLSDFTFELQDQETVATKGIDFDEGHDVANAQASFDSDVQTCVVQTVQADASKSSWYLTSGSEQTLTYAFDGNAWVFKSEDLGQESTLFSSDIEGAYSNDKGERYHGGTFTISELDVNAGTCKVEWAIKYGAADNVANNNGIPENQKQGTASGSGDVTFTQKDGAWGFDLSSRGRTEGDTTASINIRFTFDDSNPGNLKLSSIYDSYTPHDQEQWEFLVACKLKGSTIVLDKHSSVPSSVSRVS